MTIDNHPRSVNFSYTLLLNAVFTDSDIGGADFTFAYLFSKFRPAQGRKDARLENIACHGCDFTGAFMPEMPFTNMQLKKAKFVEAQLVGSSFKSEILSGTKSQGAYLHGTDFSATALHDVNFTGAFFALENGCWRYSSDVPGCFEKRVRHRRPTWARPTTASTARDVAF